MSDAPLACDAAMVGMLAMVALLGLDLGGVIALGDTGSMVVLLLNMLFATVVMITSE